MPKWIAGHMSSFFDGRGAVTAISFSYVLGVVVNFLMTPMAAVGAFGSPLAQLAVNLGLDPYTLVYSMLYGLDQLLFMGALAVRMVACALFIPAILVPYWKLIGFIN